MFVKICGNRTEKDVHIAIQSKADAIGLILGTTHYSEDEVNINFAKEIIKKYNDTIKIIHVTHLRSAKEILDIHREFPAPGIQLHGAITLSEAKKIREKIPDVFLIKAVHIVDFSSIELALSEAEFYNAIILDSCTESRLGGTGFTHDWNISQQIVTSLCDLSKPVILAGGLNPNNIGNAIEKVKPWGVDVNSGVENPNGSKNENLVNTFVNLARSNECCVKTLTEEKIGVKTTLVSAKFLGQQTAV